MVLSEGNLEVKLPTSWTDESKDGKSQRRKSQGKVREAKRRDEKRREEKRRSMKRRSEESRSKKIKLEKADAGARKGRKIANKCFPNDLWLRRVKK